MAPKRVPAAAARDVTRVYPSKRLIRNPSKGNVNLAWPGTFPEINRAMADDARDAPMELSEFVRAAARRRLRKE